MRISSHIERLGKKKIHGIQGLKRQGELWCDTQDTRVLLSGACQLYLAGTLSLPEGIYSYGE